MSLRSKWEELLKGKRAAGIEIILQGGVISLSYILLEKKGSKLQISFSGAAGAFEEVTIPAGTPVSVSISGKGILHKKISYTDDLDKSSLLQKALPNARAEDFYVQHTEPANGSVIVSVARKSSIDELLNELRKNKLDVVSCSFGPFCFASVLPWLNVSEIVSEKVYMPGHTLTVSDGQLADYMAEDNSDAPPVEIGGESIQPSLVIPFSAAAGYFTGSSLSPEIDSISFQAEESRQKKIFQLAGTSFLAFLLSLLLTNYFVFDHYWKKKQSFEVQYAGSKDAMQKYSTLKAEFDEKMSFLGESGLLETSRSSFYADRIAADVPSAIQLTEMNIHPREKSPVYEESMQFRSNEIQIHGSCRQSNELNEWIKIIKRKDWVSEVELLNYKQGKGDATGTFIIEVRIK